MWYTSAIWISNKELAIPPDAHAETRTDILDMNRPLLKMLALALFLCGLSANAQVYTTDPLMLAPTMDDGDVPIIEPRGLSLHNPIGHDNALVPVISTTRQGALSYDMTFTFTNTTSTSKPLGRICMGAIALGENITIYEHSQISKFRETSHTNFVGTGWRYPGIAYSPTMVIMSETHVVGVSMLYPVMEYKHDTLVRLVKLGGVFKGPPEGRGWMVAFDLNNAPGISSYAMIPNEAYLDPGQTCSYTICVRAMKRPDPFPAAHDRQEWLSVLAPYKDYFQSQYGPVEYERRTKPVYGAALAVEATINSQNPRGWIVAATRPDRLGFAPVVNDLIENDFGHDNVMVWTPSGLFNQSRRLNYPSRFTAGWLDSDKLRTATDQIGFPAIPRSGKQLGLWWGRAAQHMDRWNDDEAEPLDPDNPGHMSLVYLQLDLARDAGATMIGLDAFVHKYMPVWKQEPYINGLRARYPEMSFITEQMSSDVMHRVTPTSNRAYSAGSTPRAEADYHRLNIPFYLADYLNPRHETWAFWGYGEILRADPTQTINSARLQRDTERIARNGYTPVLSGVRLRLENHATVNADETWHQTQPDDSNDQNGNDDDTPPNDNGDGNRGTDGDSDDTSDLGDDAAPKADPDPKLQRVYYITLPNGRRLRIVSE